MRSSVSKVNSNLRGTGGTPLLVGLLVLVFVVPVAIFRTGTLLLQINNRWIWHYKFLSIYGPRVGRF
ncbi:hypothetical protein GGD56_006222 [Rhizobium mongolense]|uniref:Uncharacterized protein n=2 Tax=Rhizobium mongolense TaxID=57676 RepID=A0ABR6IWN1_9HYPH|nr:hypothetical protein [Rhizobium mongolense]TVZ66708.1 hypothetical protein BCL32_7117 [Rhizobium mongolense USDA 1844]